MKILAYSRKSTESDERQSQSIEDQNNWIISKIWNNPFKLFSESKSAKDPNNRPEFAKLIKEIEKTKDEEVVIYTWALNRLSRNPVDSWMIQYLMQRWKLTKIITSDREYNPTDAGLLMSLENAMSNQFILDMIKNVERWMKSKLEKWWCVTNAPYWYRNNKETKEAEIDPKYAPYIREIFELRADWYSLNSIVEIMYEKWLRTKSWKKMTKTTIEQITKNPFYIWLQKFRGELHESIHEKLVDVDLWQKVNETKRWYKKHNAEIEFPLKWIVKNWHTKKPLLALWKKQKYVYYSTHSRDEYRINMNQNHIIETFDDMIWQYILPEESKPFILKEIRDYFELYYKELKEKRKSLISDIKKLEKDSEKLFDLVMKWTIDDDIYKQKNNDLLIKKQQLKQELSNIQDFDTIIIEEANQVVELLTKLEYKWKNGDNQTKLALIKLIVVELFVDTKKRLYIEEKQLFQYIKVLNGFNWQPIKDNGRTYRGFISFIFENSNKLVNDLKMLNLKN